ncbi:MAG TPA: hypothetical protein VFQ63_00565 [Patescibacteria group bacterium]|nr:hypothetical protein [Patescibacteria group bacterium]
MTNLLAFTVDSTSVSLPAPVAAFTNGNILQNTLNVWFNLLFVIAILMALFYMIWNAFGLIRSQGDKKAIEESRTGITNSITGLIIILVTFIFINIVGYFFHANLLMIHFQ